MNVESVNKFLGEVKDAFEKAIGTSSSINEERDERSVENYVRTGGNTMENTTEPDPQGDIAVTKAYPDASSDSKHVIDQATRPTEDAKVSDAPEGPVPTNETSPSDATSAIAPTSEEMAEPVEKADSGKCPSCGQSMPVSKADEPKDADEITKAADEPETAAEAAKETPADEKKEEVKKSLWGGAFAPRK